MEPFCIEPAVPEELPKILEIYAAARRFMAQTGNPTQWQNGYPPQKLLAADIAAGKLYVLKRDGIPRAAFWFSIGADPAYQTIEQGSWRSDTPYGAVHRIASDGTEHGVLPKILAFCQKKIGHLRIDTHADNRVMQHLLCKNGFQRCGIIHLEDGAPRIAYERLPSDTVQPG